MAFLTLNGITIPTAKGGQVSPQVIGEMTRSYNGSLIRDIRRWKRQWSFTTPPLIPADAWLYRAIIEGRGEYWDFDTDTYAESGLVASTETAVDILQATGDDGDTAEIAYAADASASPAIAIGAASLWPASSNIMTSDQSDMDGAGTSGWTAVNAATLATNASHYWQGTKSLKVTTSAGAQRGAICVVAAGAAATEYTGSVWIKRDAADAGSGAITVELLDDIGSITSTAYTLAATETWYWVWVTGTTDAGAGDVRLQVIDTNAGDANTIYLDGAQMEAKGHPTHWLDGGTSRASASVLEYDGTWLAGARGLTLACWSNGSVIPTLSQAAMMMGVSCNSDADRMELYYGTTPGHQIVARTYISSATSSSASSGIYGSFGTWKHCVGVYDRDAATLKCYTDGTLRATATSVVDVDLANAETVYLGNGVNATQPLAGCLDDVLVLPYAVDATTVSAWYASGSGFTSQSFSLIRPYMAGDVVDGEEVRVIGEVITETIVGFHQSGWQSAARRLEFTLTEY